MTAYLISQVEVLDDTQWQRYGEIVAPAITQYGVLLGTPEVGRVAGADGVLDERAAAVPVIDPADDLLVPAIGPREMP
jgi:uncharacterized protein (DUF1330 family)